LGGSKYGEITIHRSFPHRPASHLREGCTGDLPGHHGCARLLRCGKLAARSQIKVDRGILLNVISFADSSQKFAYNFYYAL
jgi:hypothetical protein